MSALPRYQSSTKTSKSTLGLPLVPTTTGLTVRTFWVDQHCCQSVPGALLACFEIESERPDGARGQIVLGGGDVNAIRAALGKRFGNWPFARRLIRL